MCSRFQARVKAQDVLKRYPAVLPRDWQEDDVEEIRPTDAALVVGTNERTGAAEGHLLSWGLTVDWTAKPLINARRETLAQKPTFQKILSNRCLVPASGWFEWRAEGARKIKTWLTADTSAPPLLFAGLYDGMRFTVLTTEPDPDIAHIHNRMPVIVPLGQESAWLKAPLEDGLFQAFKQSADYPAIYFEEVYPPQKTESTDQLDLF